MSKLHVCTWMWGDKYGPEYVSRLQRGLGANLKQAFTFRVVTPAAEDKHLTEVKGCFVRLRMFDPVWQFKNGILPGDRLVCIDLDSIVTGPLDPLFLRPDEFMILTNANKGNPCPYNGSIWMVHAGYRPDVWTDFSLEAAQQIPFFEYPDDQAWFAHKIPDIIGWRAGYQSGIYAFQKRGWPKESVALPNDARLVVFPGHRDPSQFTHLDWVRDKWAA